MSAAAFKLPRLRLRWRILAPFLLLIVVLGGGMLILTSRFLSAGSEVSFTRQLRDSGQRAADEVVRVEEELLALERAIANTEGVAAAVARGDAEDIRARILQLVVNADVDAVSILDREGSSLLSIRKVQVDAPPGEFSTLRGEGFFTDWSFVRELLDLDLVSFFSENEEEEGKQVGLGELVLGQDVVPVLFVGGPLVDEQGTVFGAVLVGSYIPSMIADISEAARANISFYDPEGGLLATVFEEDSSWDPPGLQLDGDLLPAARNPDGPTAPLRSIQIAGQPYGEVLTPFQVRGGAVDLGTMGISLLDSGEEALIAGVVQGSLSEVLALSAGGAILVVVIALLVANSIAKPIDDLHQATQRILAGETDVSLPKPSDDEVGALVQSLTSVVTGLQSGTLSSPVVEPFEEPGTMYAAAEETLQVLKGSILVVTLQDFIADVDRNNPEALTATLNQLLAGIMPIVEKHDGVLQRVEGGRLLISFGLPPRRLPASVSSFLATHAALSLMEHAVENAPNGRSIKASLGLASGFVALGRLGMKDCLQYGVFGDTVDLARHFEGVSRSSGAGRLLIGEHTYAYIARAGSQFQFGRKGKVRGDDGQEHVIYEVVGRSNRLFTERDSS